MASNPVPKIFTREKFATTQLQYTVISDTREQTSFVSATYTLAVNRLRSLGDATAIIVKFNLSGTDTVNVKLNGVVQGTVTGGGGSFLDDTAEISFAMKDRNIPQVILIDGGTSAGTFKNLKIDVVVVTVVG